MAEEHASEIPYIMESEVESSSEIDHQHLHSHPLICHHQDDVDDSTRRRVCNACVRLILPAETFYRCSECPDFFLHNCCANLPTKIQLPYLIDPFYLFPKAPNSSISGCFICNICYKQSNGFAYMRKTGDYTIDVVCAMMPPSITHQLHAKSHILYLYHNMPYSHLCACCRGRKGLTIYKCISCRDFTLEFECATLPSSIKHKFDDHILTLTAGDDLPKVVQQICEIYIKLKQWCYSCRQCDQWFHTNCIQGFSNLKLGATINVNCHDCPLALVLESSLYGYYCGNCLRVFGPKYLLHESRPRIQQSAYECSNCYFRIHESCAKKCLLG